MEDAKFIIRMENITKIYPNGNIALKGVNFKLKKGEIHSLLGENGAGKSTLMNILFGIHQATEGDILVNERSVNIKSPTDALSHKIGMVHQHFMLVPTMTIAENLVLGKEISNHGIVNKKELIKFANEFAKKFNFDIDCSKLVKDVTVGIRQKVEILKALYRGAEILILDEPTAVLTPQESNELFSELKRLKEKDYSIIFISHKLEEVKALCDRITIMNNGKYIGTYDIEDLSTQQISEKMVGREINMNFKKDKSEYGETRLKVSHFSAKDKFGKIKVDNVSFEVKSGQILGIASIEGNGKEELFDRLVGLHTEYSGNIEIMGNDSKNLSIYDRRRKGLRYVPDDRMTDGIVATESIMNNLLIDRLEDGEFINHFIIDFKKVRSFAKEKVKDFQVRCMSELQEVLRLSGGNIQKVVVAREFDNNPKLLIVNQPTRGIDIGAAELIRSKLTDLRNQGSAICLYTADLQELLQLSDRILVMHNGKIVGDFETINELDDIELGYYMLGVKNMFKEGDEKNELQS